ncbi:MULTISPECIES: VirB4-like conjugal transfer ATPase, CD1110 family [unclassified Granulicatella]|uniref:VirB4-like conjugal transfer ATPase, CD1110 family n=1 Tax=unclassified Granulicatella TaxID=2630493 RepID=UPI001073F45A|nr:MULTISPECIES: DUF87 domain-containing protein [unclassified Granulicatella]MBF0780597.1 DUF87 domain-containing protein [Granulicatella sp. 19428wC4_WM01]TFU94625.1 DUF87 domain-containing protein [Granulicatella sp. WM01]
MKLFWKNTQKKRQERHVRATTQNTIQFQSMDRYGHMTITDNRYSQTYHLSDVAYTMSSYDDKINIIDTYANVLNSLENNANYQLLVVNRRITQESIYKFHYPLLEDSYDIYRQEYNQLMSERFEKNATAFELSRYMTIALDGFDEEHAKRKFRDLTIQLTEKFKHIDASLTPLDRIQRLALFAEMLRSDVCFPYNEEDIAQSGLSEKSFIVPNRIHIHEKYLALDDTFAKVKYIRHFPKSMSDKLIYELSQLGIEFALVINAGIYDTAEVLNDIKEAETDAGISLIKSQKRASQSGVFLSEEFVGSDKDKKTVETTKKWEQEIKEYDQKVFKGLIAILLKADTLQQLEEMEAMITRAGGSLGVKFEDIYYYQEEALNTVLPIGECFVDIRQKLTRRMTTANVATQVPFTQTNLISSSSKALYYGQNQLSNNLITLDRKRDLLTGSGVIVGVSGSGKSFAVKINEVIPTILRYPDDRIIIVDPEDEYSDIGEPFNAQQIDMSIGSTTHINLLDLPDLDNLEGKDAKDPVGNKANLLISIFESVLDMLSDEEVTIIDRVTRYVYQHYERPTLFDWHSVLLEQPEQVAKDLAVKVEIYTIGSQSIFSHQTNVNLSNQVVIFNLKHLSGKLKPFSLLVIQDFIWNQVINNKGKLTTWLYFDELQLYLRTPQQAIFFTELYSRVRKYGAIPTGITQNIETIYAIEEGRKLLSNSEFMMILKQKNTDIAVLKEVITLTDDHIKYISHPKAKGTGLIYAGGTIVPFENPIPKHFTLYQLVETDTE